MWLIHEQCVMWLIHEQCVMWLIHEQYVMWLIHEQCVMWLILHSCYNVNIDLVHLNTRTCRAIVAFFHMSLFLSRT